MNAIELREAVTQFLGLEAMLLDKGQFEQWLEMLDEGLSYALPIRLGTNSREEELAAGGFRFQDSKDHVRVRVKRLATGNGYAETPPSRTVRSVSSICILGEQDGIVRASNALIVYRHRANDVAGDTVHARRDDEFRITPDGLRLLTRRIILAEVTLSTPNLAIFL